MSTLFYASERSTKPGAVLSRRSLKRVALALAIGVAGVSVADLAYGYLTIGRYLETTDDAYVKANSTIIAPKVSGYIANVLVSDNESVHAGQVLARIDDRDFRTALKQAPADVAAAEAARRHAAGERSDWSARRHHPVGNQAHQSLERRMARQTNVCFRYGGG